MKLAVVLRAPPPSRIARAHDPHARPQLALRAPAPRLRLAAPPSVAAPPRLVLRAPVAAPPVARDAPVLAPIATAVGIIGAGGTRVIMVPADLTLPGRVDITQFRVAIAAGVW